MQGWIKSVVMGAALLAYAFGSHYVFTQVEHHVRLAVMWVWIPLACAGAAMVWRSLWRWPVVVSLVVCSVFIWHWSTTAISNPGLLFMIQYLAFQVGLCATFGFTLLGERVALITRLARLVHGHLPPEIERYTRRVTLVWTIFFAALAVTATVLYVMASNAIWSIFINFLTPLLIGALFTGEYLFRRRNFPDFNHSSFMTGMRAFQRSVDEREST